MSHIFRKQDPSLNFRCYVHGHRFQQKYTLYCPIANTELHGLQYMHFSQLSRTRAKNCLERARKNRMNQFPSFTSKINVVYSVIGLPIKKNQRKHLPYKLVEWFSHISQQVFLDRITDIHPMLFFPSAVNFFCYITIKFRVQKWFHKPLLPNPYR